MINYTSLPSSVAELLDEISLPDNYPAFTFTGYIDEKLLFTDINRKLNKLETSTDIDHIELDMVVRLTEQITFAKEEKEEAITRINWLVCLYKAKGEMDEVDTKEKLKKLRSLIAPVQTCPLKNQLLTELDTLEFSLSIEESTTAKQTAFELLMERSFNEAGDEFINLGKTGREHVVTEVLIQEGDLANTTHVQTLAGQLEQRVRTLLVVTDYAEMILKLGQLPLSIFSSLHEAKKERIADALIQEKGWTGLSSLDRKIIQLSNGIDREEREKYQRENIIDLPDGKVAATIDLRFKPIV